MMAKIKSTYRSFFDFNIGHLITILVCVGGFIYGYGALSTRVTNLESTMKIVVEQIGSNDKLSAAQMAAMNVKLSTIENDVAWVKKNIK